VPTDAFPAEAGPTIGARAISTQLVLMPSHTMGA
jgi:hypothetical protein